MPRIPTQKLAGVLRRLVLDRSDNEAWKALYLLMWPLVFATAYRNLRGDRELSADAGQEVFLRLYRYARFDEFTENPEAFPGYVSAMCKNVCRDYLSKILREPQLSEAEFQQSLVEFEQERSRDLVSPELSAIRSGEVSAFLSSLDPDDRRLAELLLKGVGTSEAADRLGLTYTNTAVRIYRLRQLARNAMKTG
jgi:RNA polymerase sigma factor (sigma-70 family)